MITRESAKNLATFVKNNPSLTLPEIADKKDIKISSAKRYIRACINEYGFLPQKPPLDQEREPDTPTKNKVEIEHKGNYAEVTSRTDRIKTLDQLIEEAEIDLDTWEVDKYVENKWDGQMEGGDPVPLWQVKAWLEKKVLTEKEFEPVQPITLDHSYSSPAKPSPAGVNKAVVIPDTHIGYRKDSFTQEMIPFHDRRCLDLDLQLIDDIDPETIIILGDWLDMPNWQDKFIRSKEFASITQASIDEGHWWLRNIRDTAPDAEIVQIQGNHEVRVERFLKKNRGAAYGVKPATATEDDPDLMSVENMLSLPELQIEWIGGYPDGGHWVNDNLVSEHGSRSSSVNGKSAGQILDEARESHIFAHTHRLEMATKTTYPKDGPKMYQAVSMGCQCRIGGETPGTKKKQDWQNAVGVIEYKTGNNPFYIKPIFINDGSMIYNGKSYEGNTRIEQIKAEAKLGKYNFVEFD